MNAPHWPGPELAQLHERFLEMRRTEEGVRRRDLAFQVVLLKGSVDRLDRACRSAEKGRNYLQRLHEELVEEAMFVMSRWIAAPALRFEDRGLAPFAGWYWKLCKSAAHRAAQALALPDSRSIDSLDEESTPAVAPPSAVETWWDEVMQAITQIPDLRMKAVMADLAADVPAGRTARECGISAAEVSRQRTKGIAHLQRRLGLVSQGSS